MRKPIGQEKFVRVQTPRGSNGIPLMCKVWEDTEDQWETMLLEPHPSNSKYQTVGRLTDSIEEARKHSLLRRVIPSRDFVGRVSRTPFRR